MDRDLEDELSFHLAMKAEASGEEREARRRFGNPTALKEQCRDLWTFAWIENCWQDVRYGVRTLVRNRLVSVVAILALALGIGANTTVFTVVSSALSFDLGVDRVDRIVLVSVNDASRRGNIASVLPGFEEFQSEIKSITNLAAYRFASVNVSDQSGTPERYYRVEMTAGGFAAIGRKPALGRTIAAYDQRPDATPVVLLSYRVWQDRYGLDPAIIGKTIRVDEVPRVVIGVMPAGMQFPENTDLWTPLDPIKLLATRNIGFLLVFGRLADGVQISQARAELDTIVRRLASRYPDRFKGAVADVRPMLEIYGVYDSRPLFLAMLFAVTFVLLIACADVANLLLSRAAARSREISIRIAIGAGRSRIIRQLLIESVLLSIMSGVLGWIVAIGGLRWFDGLATRTGKPPWADFSMHPRVFLYLAAISIGSGILFGLAPALQLAKVDVNNTVKDGGYAATGGSRGHRISALLVVFEMALCVVLLTGAGLMIRSWMNLYSAPIGVNPAGVLTMHINLPEAKYVKGAEEIAFHARLQNRLESLPGVESESFASHLPGAGWAEFSGAWDGAPPATSEDSPRFAGLVVGSGYFRVMQVQPVRGRLFAGAGDASSLVVNESFAARYWPGQDPLGKHLRLDAVPSPQHWFTVIGVVPDIHQNFQRPLQSDPLIYVSYAAAPRPVMFIVARTRIPPATLERAFRREVQGLDRDLPVYEVLTLQEHIARRQLNVSAPGVLFSVFGGVALVLAFAGLYGVVAHSISRRTQEIGIRMAMGATMRDVLTLVFTQGLRQVAIGLAIGLPAAFALTRVLRRMLVGVSPGDPATTLGVAFVLAIAGVLGCAIPARRATRVDPVVALRCE
jgi:predicted permease